jgi:hypothetical protein
LTNLFSLQKGFATKQEDYNAAIKKLYSGLDKLEELCASKGGPYLLGKQLTELDVTVSKKQNEARPHSNFLHSSLDIHLLDSLRRSICYHLQMQRKDDSRRLSSSSQMASKFILE